MILILLFESVAKIVGAVVLLRTRSMTLIMSNVFLHLGLF